MADRYPVAPRVAVDAGTDTSSFPLAFSPERGVLTDAQRLQLTTQFRAQHHMQSILGQQGMAFHQQRGDSLHQQQMQNRLPAPTRPAPAKRAPAKRTTPTLTSALPSIRPETPASRPRQSRTPNQMTSTPASRQPSARPPSATNTSERLPRSLPRIPTTRRG